MQLSFLPFCTCLYCVNWCFSLHMTTYWRKSVKYIVIRVLNGCFLDDSLHFLLTPIWVLIGQSNAENLIVEETSGRTGNKIQTGTQSECVRREWQGTREGGSSKVTQRRENKVSAGYYNNSTSHCLTVISVSRSLPLLSSASVESYKPEPGQLDQQR